MTLLPAELDLVIVSALFALVLGGAVRLFGARWLLVSLGRAGGFAMRRRGLSTALLGATASAGLAVANAIGLQAPGLAGGFNW